MRKVIKLAMVMTVLLMTGVLFPRVSCAGEVEKGIQLSDVPGMVYDKAEDLYHWLFGKKEEAKENEEIKEVVSIEKEMEYAFWDSKGEYATVNDSAMSDLPPVEYLMAMAHQGKSIPKGLLESVLAEGEITIEEMTTGLEKNNYVDNIRYGNKHNSNSIGIYTDEGWVSLTEEERKRLINKQDVASLGLPSRENDGKMLYYLDTVSRMLIRDIAGRGTGDGDISGKNKGGMGAAFYRGFDKLDWRTKEGENLDLWIRKVNATNNPLCDYVYVLDYDEEYIKNAQPSDEIFSPWVPVKKPSYHKESPSNLLKFAPSNISKDDSQKEYEDYHFKTKIQSKNEILEELLTIKALQENNLIKFPYFMSKNENGLPVCEWVQFKQTLGIAHENYMATGDIDGGNYHCFFPLMKMSRIDSYELARQENRIFDNREDRKRYTIEAYLKMEVAERKDKKHNIGTMRKRYEKVINDTKDMDDVTLAEYKKNFEEIGYGFPDEKPTKRNIPHSEYIWVDMRGDAIGGGMYNPTRYKKVPPSAVPIGARILSNKEARYVESHINRWYREASGHGTLE